MATSSYHPVEHRDFEALKTTLPPGLEIKSIKGEGLEEAIWLSALSPEPRSRPASVLRHAVHGVNVVLQVYSDPGILSLLANHWQCALIDEKGDKRVEPGDPILKGSWAPGPLDRPSSIPPVKQTSATPPFTPPSRSIDSQTPDEDNREDETSS